jgi:hypothetical protein
MSVGRLRVGITEGVADGNELDGLFEGILEGAD